MKFCGQCTEPLALVCPKCQFQNPPGFKFCGQCTTPLSVDTGTTKGKYALAKPAASVRVVADDAPETVEGERKTVTALFADIKGSMELMEDIDPEEARSIVDPALKLMIDAAHRYDGYIVQSTGDGVFAIFGAPVAHEDHPQRALYAALRIQDEMQRYSARLREAGHLPIEARVGVNTGEVVVRSIKTDDAHTEYTPIGHSISLASRMQALAPIGSIATTERLRKLCEGYFLFESLGPTRVKGVTEHVLVYEVTGLGPLRTPLQRAARRGLTKFVGRQPEMEAMAHAARLAESGHGQIVAAVAEAGVGKSRLFFEFRARNQSGWKVLEAISFSHGKASVYLPVVGLLNTYCGIDTDDDTRKRHEKVNGKILTLDRALEDVLPHLYSLLELTEGDDPLAQMDAHARRRKTLDAIKRIVLREALNQPLMVIFEDLHWIDAETQALLDLLTESIAAAKVLMLVNYRPEYKHDWGNRASYTQLRLQPLTGESAAELLTALLGDAVEVQPLRRMIMESTAGNPLFIEETIQALIEDGALVRNGEVKITKPVGQLRIPSTVQAILAARIDRLGSDEKQLLQTLAIIGNEFPLGLVTEVTGKPESMIVPMLAELEKRGFIFEQLTAEEVRYSFKHALTHDVAASLMLTERRQALHERTAQAIESLYADRIDAHVDELAHHYAQSANTPKAVDYLTRASEWAYKHSAFREADAHVSTGMSLLERLPLDDDRARRELALQLIASDTAALLKGYAAPELVAPTARAVELADRLSQPRDAFRARARLLGYHAIGGDPSIARQLAEDMVVSAEKSGDPALRVEAHAMLGYYLNTRGDFALGRDHLEVAVKVSNSASDQRDRGMMVSSCRAHANLGASLFALGFPDQGIAMVRRSVELARETSDADAIALSLCYHMLLHWSRGDVDETLIASHKAAAAAEQHEFSHWVSWAVVAAGWATARKGQITHDTGLLNRGLEMLGRLSVGDRHWSSAMAIADVAWRACDWRMGLAALEGLGDWEGRADLRVDLTSRARLWKGELLTLVDADVETQEAKELFRRCIDDARKGGAKSSELRAATGLARLLAKQGKREEARTMLAEIYGWFTEGFDTADLKDAKALLDALNG